MTPKEIADLEQTRTYLAAHFPAFWAGMYRNLTTEGFRPDSAFQLVQTYILSQGTAPVQLKSPPDDKPKEEE